MGFFAPLLAMGAGAGAGAILSAGGVGTAAAIGGGLTLFGHIMSGISQYNQYQYQADVAKQQAQSTGMAAEYQERRMREQANVLRSRQIASAAGSGIIPFYGSPLEVQIESRRNVLEDINAMWFNARTGMSQAQSQAKMYEMAAPMALGSSIIGAGGSLFNAYQKSSEFKIPKSGFGSSSYPGERD